MSGVICDRKIAAKSENDDLRNSVSAGSGICYGMWFRDGETNKKTGGFEAVKVSMR